MKKSFVIGVAGGTGSGKTTFVEKILSSLPSGELCVISQDSYYNETNNLSHQERISINFDHPEAIDFDLLVKHISQLKKNEIIEQPVYSFVTHNRTDDVVLTNPKKIILIEGILIFNDDRLRDLCDVKIFVDADEDERLIRRIRRDVKERGRGVDEVLLRYQTTLKPMHEVFIEPTKQFADIIVPNNRYNDVAVDMVCSVIKEHLYL